MEESENSTEKNKEIIEDSNESKFTLIQRITSYGPLLITVCILLLQTFFPNILVSLPINILLAILVGGTIFLIWHVEIAIYSLIKDHKKLNSKVNELEKTQSQFINSTTSLSNVKLGSAFSQVSKASPRVGHLRIFAISSQQILSFLKYNEIQIDKCDILLRSFKEEEKEENIDFINQIKLVIADWKRLQSSGKIKELTIRHYDFFPTEYECIFDREHLILGLYDSDPDDYSKVKVRDPILVKSSSDSGRVFVSEFADRFDKLFSTCENNHGSNILIKEEKKGKT